MTQACESAAGSLLQGRRSETMHSDVLPADEAAAAAAAAALPAALAAAAAAAESASKALAECPAGQTELSGDRRRLSASAIIIQCSKMQQGHRTALQAASSLHTLANAFFEGVHILKTIEVP